MKKIESNLAEIYTIDDFLSKEECNYLILKIDETAVPSTVAGGDVPSVVSEYRTSYSGHLPLDDNKIIQINNKIHYEMKIENNLGEAIQGQRYQVGQEFKDHTDFFEGKDIKIHCSELGNRTWTFMIYLNDNLEGGETDFPKLGLKFKPKQGMAVIWRNKNNDGIFNENTLHAGRPVIEGSKYIITKWFRDGVPYVEKENIVTESKTFNSHETIPKFTEKGFIVKKVPESTWRLIKDSYELLKPYKREEHKDWVLENKSGVNPTEILSFDTLPRIKEIIHNDLLPYHEEWSGQKLEPSFIYGIRSYKKGSTLAAHKDRIQTHHISTIIIVDREESDPNWGLDIQAHDGTWHKVFAEVGDMILYESAACEHARLDENPAEYFRNFFCHYKLVDYKYIEK